MQGELLFLLLFIIVMEVTNKMLKKASELEMFKGLKMVDDEGA